MPDEKLTCMHDGSFREQAIWLIPEESAMHADLIFVLLGNGLGVVYGPRIRDQLMIYQASCNRQLFNIPQKFMPII